MLTSERAVELSEERRKDCSWFHVLEGSVGSQAGKTCLDHIVKVFTILGLVQ